MKRIRADQLQTTTLLYLKKRNFTDSEATFRQNFKFSTSPFEAASHIVKKSLISNFDVVAMMSECLDEYFLAFKAFQEFVVSSTKVKPNSGLKKFLFPVFLHVYLDLIIAQRQHEAEEFYSLFYDENIFQFENRNDVLMQLHKIKEPNDLHKYPLIQNIRKKTCQVHLGSDEKELLLRFLHGQEHLVVMKIINERLSIIDTKQCNLENITIDEIMIAQQSLILSKKRLSTDAFSESQENIERKSIDREPMIIRPPSLHQSMPAFSSNQSSDKLNFEVTVNDALLRSQIKSVRSSQPFVQGMNLYQFEDSKKTTISVSMSNSEQYICSSREDSAVMLWNLNQPVSERSTCDLDKDTTQYFRDVSLVTFGNEFKADVNEKTAKICEERKRRLSQDRVVLLQAHSGPVYSSVFTHDDKYLLTGSEDTSVRLWDINTMSNKVLYSGHNYPVTSVAVSTFSFYFASGSMDRTAKLWSLEHTFPIRIFAGHEQSVETVAFHSNTSYLASADQTVRLWDVNSGKTVRLLLGHWAPVTCLSFSPDGKLLASAGEDCRIRIWDIASGNLFKEIRSHTDTIYSVTFGPDSSLLASCGADGRVKVWNTAPLPSFSAADASHKKNFNNHLVASWNLQDHADKLLFSNFSGDLLNCIAVL